MKDGLNHGTSHFVGWAWGIIFIAMLWNTSLPAREVDIPAEPLLDLFLFGSAATMERQPYDPAEKGDDHFPTQNLDTKVRRIIHGGDSSVTTTPREERYRVISDIGVASLVFTPAVGAYYANGNARPGLLSTTLHAYAINNFVTTGLKVAIKRQRPKRYDHPKEVFSSQDSIESFPSGHASNAFAAATITRLLFPQIPTPGVIGLYGGAAFVGLMRMAADKHFFSDVAMGAMVGTGAAYLSYYTFERPHEWAILTDSTNVEGVWRHPF